jgi:hypothetical protein
MLRRGEELILREFARLTELLRHTSANFRTRFGVGAVLLEMIPVAGIFFAFTNACGAALWSADLEQHAGSSPALREQAKKAE